MKDVLNQRVKFREGFRPFAPSVLEDRASDVFELEGPAPFMLRVVPVRPEWRKRVPAITHVDDTARVQTVSREACPYYHELITRFHVETGVPLVLNTSFNLRGMPIVESPWDALVCFLFTRMDGLVMDHFYVPAPAPADFVFELAQGWKLALVQPFTSAQSSSLRATSPGGNTTNFAVSPALAHLVADIDGKRTLGELIADVDDDLFEGLQLLLRKSILSLRVGKLRLPVGLGATSLSQAEIETLVRDAGMISAHLMDL